MPDPFDFNPYGSYASLFGRTRPPSARDMLPQVDPEEERSTVGWLMEGALGGLGYIGSLLDKTFGARGVRGALGGRPEELLSILPFSDTFGITNQANEVTGRDLLADVGLATRRRPDEPFDWSDDILGMGAEIILDPSTFLSLGTTAAGKVAQKAGTLAKGFGAQMRAGQRGLTAGFPFSGSSAELLSGPQVLDAASWLRSGATAPTRGIDYVANAIGGVTPFQGAQRRLYDNVLEPAGRLAYRWFDDAVKGAGNWMGQILGRNMDANERLLQRGALGEHAQRTIDLTNLARQTPERDRVLAEMRAAFGPEADQVIALQDAYARAYAKGTGSNTEDYFKGLSAVQGGTPGKNAFRQEDVPLFYSKLSEVVNQKMQGPMDAGQLRKMLASAGVKPDEMLWSRMDDLSGKVTKEQVQEHLAENAVQVKEVMKGADHGTLNSIAKELQVAKEERSAYIRSLPPGMRASDYVEVQQLDKRIADLSDGYDRELKNVQASQETKHSRYQTPGGSNYKELLLTLPTKGLSAADQELLQRSRKSIAGLTDEEMDRLEKIENNQASSDYISSHWNEPNVLAHIRMNDRVGPDGKKILFVEEIQSDWHQAGRDKGYTDPAVRKKIDDNQAKLITMQSKTPEFDALWRETYDLLETQKHGAVPDAPFKKNWEQLAMKRVMKYAAENGYDRVAWLPGAEQAKRYDLAKQVYQMRWSTKDGSKVLVIEPRGGNTIFFELDGAGKIVNGGEAGADYTGKALSDVVGKDLARKIVDGEQGVLKDTDLSIGGEGMKGFYDKKLVNTTNDLIKKYGAKVEPGAIGDPPRTADIRVEEGFHGEGGSYAFRATVDGVPVGPWEDTSRGAWLNGKDHADQLERRKVPYVEGVPTFDITPAMRDEILAKGLPLFQDAKGSYEVLANSQRVIRALSSPDLSTLAHETAHDFFTHLNRVSPELAEQAAKATGAESFARIGREHQENFARGFEDYLRTGSAPSSALASVFQQFKAWLVNIYKSIVGTPLEGKLNPELKKVFDTMLTAGDDLPRARSGFVDQNMLQPLYGAYAHAIETAGNPGNVDTLANLQKTSTQSAFDEIMKYHAPGLANPDDLTNLKAWAADTGELLNPVNQNLYDTYVKDFDKMILGEKIPGVKDFPDDVGGLTLLNALKDRINAGETLGKIADDYTLTPSAAMQAAAKAEIDNVMAAGPPSFDIANHPAYNRSIGKAETFTPAGGRKKAEYDAWLDSNLTPEDRLAFDNLVAADKRRLDELKAMELATGARGGYFTDSWIDYMTRHIQKYLPSDPRSKTQKSFQSWTKALKASNESFESRIDIFRNVPDGTAQINEWAMDPALSGANRTMSEEQVKAHLRKELTGTENPAKGNPAWKQAEGLAKWLEGLPPEHVASQIPFFSADVPQLMFARTKGANRVKAIGDTFYDAFTRFGDTAEGWKARGQDDLVSAFEIAKTMNLGGADETGSIAARKLADAGKVTQVATDAGERYRLEDLKGLMLPRDVAEDMLKFNQAMTMPRVLEPVVKAWDWASNLTKSYLTRPFLSFHTRNFVAGLFNTWRSGASLSPETMKQTWELLRGRGDNAIPGMNRDEIWKELVAGGIAFTPNTNQMADVLGAGGEIVSQGIRRPVESGRSAAGDLVERFKQEGRDIAADKGKLNPLKTDNSLLSMATEAGNQIEDFLRVNNYLSLRKKGWTPEAASNQVMKYQIDYSRLSDFERNFAKRVLPWYSFSKGTLPVVLEDLVTQPAKIATPMRTVTGGRPQGEFVPSYIGEGAALPLGANEDGSQRYLTSFGLPIEDESLKTLGSLIKGDFTRAGEQVLGMTFPWIKSPLEMIFGKQLYSGRPLTDLKPYEFADLGGLLNEKQARVLTELAANTPASRTLGTINRFTDPRKDFVDQLLGFGTGAKISDVDVNRAYNAAITKVIGDMLKGQSGVRTREEVYVPADRIPMLNQADAEKYALYLRAEQRLREAAEARKKAAAK